MEPCSDTPVAFLTAQLPDTGRAPSICERSEGMCCLSHFPRNRSGTEHGLVCNRLAGWLVSCRKTPGLSQPCFEPQPLLCCPTRGRQPQPSYMSALWSMHEDKARSGGTQEAFSSIRSLSPGPHIMSRIPHLSSAFLKSHRDVRGNYSQVLKRLDRRRWFLQENWDLRCTQH